MGRAGSGRDVLKNDGPGRAGKVCKCDGLVRAAAHSLKIDGPGRAAAHLLKVKRAGPGRGPSYQKLMAPPDPPGPARSNPGPAHQRQPMTSPGFSGSLYIHDFIRKSTDDGNLTR